MEKAWMNSKRKGQRGEREFAAVLASHGYEARRSQQYCGVAGDADLVVDMPGVHFEVKRVETLNVHKAFAQASKDARVTGDMPVVAFKRNRGEWMVAMAAEDWLKLMEVLGD
jgi:Holliday junction resolvase